MEIQDFAQKYMQPFQVKGDEIIPELCPFCKGGGSKDRKTFALNSITGIYNCKRGSCGKSGTFWQLCQEFGEVAEKHGRTIEHKQKTYQKPTTPVTKLTAQAADYLRKRGISDATQAAYKIGCTDRGSIVFRYYDGAEVVLQKFRTLDKRFACDTGGKPVLFGMDKCDYSKPLYVFEGEIDAMSGHEAGLPNCVSVPMGAENLQWIEECWDWLHRFKEVRLYGDNDAPGQNMIRAVAKRLADLMVFRVAHEHKDANELLMKCGPEAVRKAGERAEEIKPAGLIDLADVKPLDVKKIPSCKSGITEIDKKLGGFIMGDVSIWTGKRGEGKSTLLSQVLLESIETGRKVCAYSGELSADRFQYWTDLQAAGSLVKQYHDEERGFDVQYVDPCFLHSIHEWYRGKYYLYDNTIIDGSEYKSILNVFEAAARRYGCTVFMVDNLMTCEFKTLDDDNYYRAQSIFVGRLVEFARRFYVHVHLVAHPRKVKPGGGIENDDVAGASEITNRAANVFSVERVTDKAKGFDSMLTVLKNRWEGRAGLKIGMNFDQTCKRFYPPSSTNNRSYGWEFEDHELPAEFLPF